MIFETKQEVIKAIQNGIDVTAIDNYAIRWASKYGYLEVVKFLSTLPGVDASTDDNYAIQWASIQGHLEVVKFLSTLPGVDASAHDNYAIQWASELGHLEVVKFLLLKFPNIRKDKTLLKIERIKFKWDKIVEEKITMAKIEFYLSQVTALAPIKPQIIEFVYEPELIKLN